MLRLEVPGKRRRGRPKRQFMDVVREGMPAIGVTEQDTRDRVKWRKMFRAAERKEEDAFPCVCVGGGGSAGRRR